MTVAEIMEQAKTLTAQERKELVKRLVDTLDAPISAAPDREKHSILELTRLGAEVQKDIDAQEYIDQLRGEWDQRHPSYFERKFLKLPQVGASVQQLKKALQGYSSSNDVAILVETVRAVYQNQGLPSTPETAGKTISNGLTRENLRLRYLRLAPTNVNRAAPANYAIIKTFAHRC